MLYIFIILLAMANATYCMEKSELKDYFGLIPNDIANVILNFITDQNNHDTQLTLENFKNLLICRRFNKRFCHLVDTKVQTFLGSEKALVNRHYEEDYSQKSIAKNINVLENILNYSEKQIDTIYNSLSDNKKLGCALQRNLLLYIFDFFKKNPTKITSPFYYALNATEKITHEIYPITWAVYTDAHESQNLLTSMYSNDTLLESQSLIALIKKQSFNNIQPIKYRCLKFLNPR